MSADDPEVTAWCERCFADKAIPDAVRAHNAGHLMLRLADPVYRQSDAGERARRTIENLRRQGAK